MRGLAVFALIVSQLSGCKNEPASPANDSSSVNPSTVIVEGASFYFGGGGTVEHQYPPGYKLMNCKWISPSTRTDTGFSVYLSSSLDSSYLNRRIRAFGTLDSISVPWQFGNAVDYAWQIDVDSLRIMN